MRRHVLLLRELHLAHCGRSKAPPIKPLPIRQLIGVAQGRSLSTQCTHQPYPQQHLRQRSWHRQSRTIHLAASCVHQHLHQSKVWLGMRSWAVPEPVYPQQTSPKYPKERVDASLNNYDEAVQRGFTPQPGCKEHVEEADITIFAWSDPIDLCYKLLSPELELLCTAHNSNGEYGEARRNYHNKTFGNCTFAYLPTPMAKNRFSTPPTPKEVRLQNSRLSLTSGSTQLACQSCHDSTHPANPPNQNACKTLNIRQVLQMSVQLLPHPHQTPPPRPKHLRPTS